MITLAPKTTLQDEIERELAWFASLRKCIEDHELFAALEAIDAAMALLERKYWNGYHKGE